MSEYADAVTQRGEALLALYDDALADVYGYLLRRCGSAPVAEDLTSETFAAAVVAVRQDRVPSMTVAWLIGVARHKLVDHWRRQDREERALTAVDGDRGAGWTVDDWDARLDATLAHDALARLRPQHRAALTLRYLDGLPVVDVAHHLGRTVGATEVLLVRAKGAFRAAYDRDTGGSDAGRAGRTDHEGGGR
jgi:RNA polymerase sigma-70 factor (ECF subfamily)